MEGAWRWIFVCFCGFWYFWMLFDLCLRNLMLWTYLVGLLRLFVSLSWGRFIWRIWKNVFEAWDSFEVVWEVWERLSVTAFYSARLFWEGEWLSCQTCVVWLKSELWKRAATSLSCFHMVAEPQWPWGWGADAKRGCCDLWKIDTGLLRRF